jgi:hypothetical protein
MATLTRSFVLVKAPSAELLEAVMQDARAVYRRLAMDTVGETDELVDAWTAYDDARADFEAAVAEARDRLTAGCLL